jgi:hypothetical protein
MPPNIRLDLDGEAEEVTEHTWAKVSENNEPEMMW